MNSDLKFRDYNVSRVVAILTKFKKFLYLNANDFSPYGKDFLLALKKARIKQVRSQAVANELFTYFIFLMVLFVISYANRDQDSFNIKNHIGEYEVAVLFTSRIPDNSLENNLVRKYKFDEVRTSDDWWRWAHQAIVRELKAGPLYNGQPPYGYRGYVGDLTQRMMGFATLRQVRVKRNTCRVAHQVQNLTRECAQSTAFINEDQEDYCNAWEEQTDLTRDLPSCQLKEFKYTTSEALDGAVITGNLDSYQGGGYVFNIKGKNSDLRSKLLTLHTQRWVNNQTRAVILGERRSTLDNTANCLTYSCH